MRVFARSIDRTAGSSYDGVISLDGAFSPGEYEALFITKNSYYNVKTESVVKFYTNNLYTGPSVDLAVTPGNYSGLALQDIFNDFCTANAVGLTFVYNMYNDAFSVTSTGDSAIEDALEVLTGVTRSAWTGAQTINFGPGQYVTDPYLLFHSDQFATSISSIYISISFLITSPVLFADTIRQKVKIVIEDGLTQFRYRISEANGASPTIMSDWTIYLV